MDRTCSHRLALILGSAFLALLLGVRAQAQQCPISGSTVISCPNQIEGTLTLTSSNPTIVSVLENAGPALAGLSVRSVGTPTVLISTTSSPIGGPNNVPYEITVQGGDAGSGIAHDVLAGLYRQTGPHNYYSYYVFSPAAPTRSSSSLRQTSVWTSRSAPVCWTSAGWEMTAIQCPCKVAGLKR